MSMMVAVVARMAMDTVDRPLMEMMIRIVEVEAIHTVMVKSHTEMMKIHMEAWVAEAVNPMMTGMVAEVPEGHLVTMMVFLVQGEVVVSFLFFLDSVTNFWNKNSQLKKENCSFEYWN